MVYLWTDNCKKHAFHLPPFSHHSIMLFPLANNDISTLMLFCPLKWHSLLEESAQVPLNNLAVNKMPASLRPPPDVGAHAYLWTHGRTAHRCTNWSFGNNPRFSNFELSSAIRHTAQSNWPTSLQFYWRNRREYLSRTIWRDCTPLLRA